MILSIELINWRSHEKSILEFSKGTNLLIGNMGSGKSTILDGIAFGLFGTFPALERRKITLEDIFRLNENVASVSLEFLWEGKKYKVSRKIEKKKSISSDAEIHCEGKLVEKGPTAVTQYVEQLLSVDYDLFTRAIYSEQNNIDYFMALDPRRRKQEMDILLGLDRFEAARANCTSLLNRVKSDRFSLEQKFNAKDLKGIREKLGQVLERETFIIGSMQTAREKLNSQVFEVASAENEYATVRGKWEEAQKLEKEKAGLKAKAEILGKDCEAFDVNIFTIDVEPLKLNTEKKRAELQLKNSGIQNLSSRCGALDAQMKFSRKQQEERFRLNAELLKLGGGDALEKLKLEVTQLKGKNNELRAELSAGNAKIKELEKSCAGIDAANEFCPYCERKLEAGHMERVAHERKARIEEECKRITQLGNEISEAEAKLLTNEKSINLMETIISKISMTRDSEPEQHEKLLAEAAALKILAEAEKRKLEVEFEALRNELETAKRRNLEIENMRKKIAELNETKQRLTNLEEKLAQIQLGPEVYETSRKRLEQAKVGYEQTAREIEKLEVELKGIFPVKEMLTKEINELEALEREIRKAGLVEEELSIYKNALLSTQIELREQLIESINGAMNEIWHIIYPYGDYKQLRVGVNEKDYVFEFFDGDWKTLDSIASGGERACAALTLRVALAMVLTPNLSWLILDEPTHNLDKQAVELLSTTLQYKVPEVVNQTFVITHEESLMGSEFASSYMLKREKETLGSTKIERS